VPYGKRGGIIWGIRSERAEKVVDRFGGVPDRGAADFGEAERSVEGVRDGIGWVEIDFADDATVASGFGTLEEVEVEGAGVAFAASCGGDYYPVYVNEIFVGKSCEEGAEPAQVFMIVGKRLIEGDEQGIGIIDGRGEKRGADDLVEFGEGEWRELDGVVVVEGEEGLGGGEERLDLGCR